MPNTAMWSARTKRSIIWRSEKRYDGRDGPSFASRAQGRLSASPTTELRGVEMHSRVRSAVGIVALVANAVTFARPAGAADWRSRSVTIIVPLAAGGNTDMMARLRAEHLTAKL